MLGMRGGMKKLPNVNKAIIPQKKITNYLLSPTHSSGRDKAVFFRRFGFTSDSWEVLAQALQQHAVRHEVVKIEASPFGSRYVIEGRIRTPSGRTPRIRVVWFIEAGEGIPRFVTAYPLKGD
jgi:hypothetical protein